MHIELLENNSNNTYEPKIIAAYRSPNETCSMFYLNLKEMFPNVANNILERSANSQEGVFIMYYNDIKQTNREQNLCDTFEKLNIKPN